MSNDYPYKSRLKQQLNGIDHRIWQRENLQDAVDSTSKPIIEIGGPTQDGFFFVDGIKLVSAPIITNISHNPLPFSSDAQTLAKQVDQVFDATKMPFTDDSVGIFLMAAMSISSDWWVELPDAEKKEAESTFEAEFVNAKFEMGQVAAGIQDPRAVKDAQRVKIYLEITRCLTRNGLLFTDGSIEEISILKRMGFELIACVQIAEKYGISYEFVARKRFQPV